MNFKFDLNRHTWLAYPLFAVMFMITSMNILLASQDQLREVFEKRNQIESVEEQVNKLREKVKTLSALDQSTAGSELDLLSAAVPPSRQVWSMILGIRQAAASANVILDSYRVSVGDVREASRSAQAVNGEDLGLKISAAFEISDLTLVAALSEQINNLMPLLRVVSVKYTPSKTDLIIEGAWSPWGKTISEPEEALPDYSSAVGLAVPLLDGKTNAATIPVGEAGETETPVSSTGLF